MPYEMRIHREQFEAYRQAMEAGKPIEPPAGGWSIGELIAIAGMARWLAFDRLYAACEANIGSNESAEFYRNRTGDEVLEGLGIAYQVAGDVARRGEAWAGYSLSIPRQSTEP